MNRIILDCERMKYPHTGLYHFCKQLGDALLEKNDPDAELTFYVPSSGKKAFGAEAKYIVQSPLHKFNLPSTDNFDIWHASNQATAYYPFDRRIHIVLTIHDLNFMYDPGKEESKKQRYLEKLQKKVDRADHVVAISQFTQNDLFKYLHVPKEKTSVVYNGCNIADVHNLQSPRFIPPAPFLFSIGTITEKKNFHVLPALLSGNDLQLVIAGITQKEDYKKKIIAEAKKWGVETRLFFPGSINENDKQWYLKNCRAFVFPSISEGFGLPVVEAMHFGKPCLLSSLTSLPEIGGKEAYYFESFDPADMRQALVEALEDYDQRNPAAAIKKRSGLFSWKKAAEDYLLLYKKLTATD
jgi:glycosyltransferase involved in cell wall biosynthesis